MVQVRLITDDAEPGDAKGTQPAGARGASKQARLYTGRPNALAKALRAAISFAVVVSAYTAYSLLAVPLIEPGAEASAGPDLPAVPPAPPPTEALKPYFPPGSWELDNPKLLRSERTIVLVKEYQNQREDKDNPNAKSGSVKLQPCTVLFFDGDGKPGDTKNPPIIMQAPEGATLRFDEKIDLQRMMKPVRLIGGKLHGKITIRRDASRPGAADDLFVTTHDAVMTEDRVVTPHRVDFRFGPSYGSGTEMTMMLSRNAKPAEARDGGEKKSFGITGIQSFQLLREVRIHMLSGNKDAQNSPAGDAPPAAGRRANQPPVEVTCRGPFRFDLIKYVATFHEHVDVQQLNSSGPNDQLTCELLSIFFARRGESPDKPQPGQPASGPAAGSAANTKNGAANSAVGGATNLEPRRIEAQGEPVTIRSPSTGFQAQSQRLEYDLVSGRISLLGVGTLDSAPPNNPGQKYQARWTNQLRFEPHSTMPEAGSHEAAQMISLLGSARVRVSDAGTRAPAGTAQPASLAAEEIYAWLEPPGPHAAAQPSSLLQPAGFERSPTGANPRPKRIVAQKMVQLDSVPLIGATGRLEVFFLPVKDGVAAAGGDAASGNPADTQQPGPTERREPASQQQFKAAGNQMRAHFVVRGDRPELAGVLLEGHAELRELKTARPDEKPLLVTGDRVQLAGGDGPDSQVVVTGQPGYVEARGMTLSGANIEFLRRANLVRVEHPGRMTLPVARDLNGAPLKSEQRLDITWQGRMRFDGHTARFEQKVDAHSPQQVLRTETLEVTLKQPIDFANAQPNGGQGQETEIDQVVCKGGVYLENRTFDERGLSSVDRMVTVDLAINRTTGGIDGHAPGWVSRVWLGARPALAGPAAPGGAKPIKAGEQANPVEDRPNKADADENQLSYLNVQFARSVTGNIDRRELTFADQTQTIYGPVEGWEQKLDAEDLDALPPGSVTMNCDQITVREMPDAAPVRAGTQRRGSMELEAVGNTVVEGTGSSGFTARAHRLTYAEQKGLLVLEGDNHSDAKLYRQAKRGEPIQPIVAQSIRYWPLTQQFDIPELRFIDFGPFSGGPKATDKSKKKPKLK